MEHEEKPYIWHIDIERIHSSNADECRDSLENDVSYVMTEPIGKEARTTDHYLVLDVS